MKFDPEIHHRRSIRLRGYDYSANGAYFVTLCVQGRQCLFGEVAGGVMTLNAGGRMVEGWWRKVPEKFGDTGLDEYVLMPNHFHGILRLVGADPRVCPELPDPRLFPGFKDARMGAGKIEGAHMGAPLHRIVQWFKTMTTNAYIRGVDQDGWPPFPGRLWQRNYFERVLRDEGELDGARRYIADNPVQWSQADGENPANLS